MAEETEMLARGIKSSLPEEVRSLLRHRIRNGLQSIISSMEVEGKDASIEVVFEMGEDLRRLGL